VTSWGTEDRGRPTALFADDLLYVSDLLASDIQSARVRGEESEKSAEPLGNAFDITWLTVVCVRLKEMTQGKKPKVRIHS